MSLIIPHKTGSFEQSRYCWWRKSAEKWSLLRPEKLFSLTFYQEARKVAFCGRTVYRLLAEHVYILQCVMHIAQWYWCAVHILSCNATQYIFTLHCTVCTVLNVSSILSIVLYFCEQVTYFESLCSRCNCSDSVCIFNVIHIVYSSFTLFCAMCVLCVLQFQWVGVTL